MSGGKTTVAYIWKTIVISGGKTTIIYSWKARVMSGRIQ